MGPSSLLIALTRILVGASPRWVGFVPGPGQRIFFANHSSHLDTVALWSALPSGIRSSTRPVAAADYWNRGALKRWVAVKGLNAVFIERVRENGGADPLRPLAAALERGESLILFPEGTRNRQALPGPFKSGLYHLAMRFPDVELVPVYLENLHRCLPKGTVFPVPLTCTVRFGAALQRIPSEGKAEFLARARSAVVELA